MISIATKFGLFPGEERVTEKIRIQTHRNRYAPKVLCKCCYLHNPPLIFITLLNFIGFSRLIEVK